MKFKKGDQVKIATGKDAGRTGKIEKVLAKENKVIIEGVNQYKRHIKSRFPGQKSEILTITKPLPAGNIALICPKCKQAARIGFKLIKNEKVRICRKCEEEIN